MDKVLSMNRIYCIGELSQPVNSSHHTSVINSVDELPKQHGNLLIIAKHTKNQDDLLIALHQQRHFWSTMVLIEEHSNLSEYLGDGVWPIDYDLNGWELFTQRLNLFKDIDNIEPIIGWLGALNSRRLKPLLNSAKNAIYTYPILDAYLPKLDSQFRFVHTEQKMGLFEVDKEINRIRACSGCNSSHLNYVEVCPACSHFDIGEQSSLHCFTCGHVNEQQKFSRNGVLKCPKCLTQLRHIGVDYDRPLETHHCNSCAHNFVQTSTSANCLDCGKEHAIDQLIIRRVRSYKIGEQGEHMLRYGGHFSPPELSLKGKVDTKYFLSVLSWTNSVARRHQEEHLLVGMHLPGLTKYNEQYGEERTFALTEQITERLNGLFRESDICCQYRDDFVLLLMPKTPFKHLPVLKEKISKLCALIEEDDFSMSIFAWGIPQEINNAEITQWLDNQLEHVSNGQ